MTEESDDSDSDDVGPQKKKTKNDRQQVMKVILSNPKDFGVRRSSRSALPNLSESSNDSSESQSSSESSDDDFRRSKPKSKKINDVRRSTRPVNQPKEIDYGISSESDEDDETAKRAKLAKAVDEGEKIEKVLDSRDGPVGFVGNQTILYNDAAMPPIQDGDHSERQYLIKWTGWSNLHNTWESMQSIKTLGCAGIRKLENFIKREEEAEFWLRDAQPEESEYHMIQKEMEREVYQQHVLAERIIAKRIVQLDQADSNGRLERLEFMIKWKGLPYSDATWEEESLCVNRFETKIKEFNFREANSNRPCANASYQKRGKFKKRDHFDCIPDGLSLRDYQNDGVNWLTHAWCKGNSCILADEMGLGKTIQTITFLNNLFVAHGRAGPFFCCVPLSTLASWQSEFQKVWVVILGKSLA